MLAWAIAAPSGPRCGISSERHRDVQHERQRIDDQIPRRPSDHDQDEPGRTHADVHGLADQQRPQPCGSFVVARAEQVEHLRGRDQEEQQQRHGARERPPRDRLEETRSAARRSPRSWRSATNGLNMYDTAVRNNTSACDDAHARRVHAERRVALGQLDRQHEEVGVEERLRQQGGRRARRAVPDQRSRLARPPPELLPEPAGLLAPEEPRDGGGEDPRRGVREHRHARRSCGTRPTRCSVKTIQLIDCPIQYAYSV